MALVIDRLVTALETPPSQNNVGFDVRNFALAICTLSEFQDVTGVQLAQYGLTDDEGDGASTFPNGQTWPQLDDFRRTRNSASVIAVPLAGLSRWRPNIGSWNATGGSPQVRLKARLVSSATVARLGLIERLNGLSDTEIDRLVLLASDSDTPADLSTSSTIDPESANVIRINIVSTDLAGVKLNETIRFEAEVFDLDMLQQANAAFTATVAAPGSQLSTTGAGTDPARVLGITDANGEASLDITDVAGASSAFLFIRVQPWLRLGFQYFTFIAFDGV